MIKWFDSRLMTGIPVLTNNQGDLVKMLNGLLVNGANSKPVATISYANGTCTLEIGAGHGFLANSIIDIQGSSQSALIGLEFRIKAVTVSTISFDVPTTINNELGTTVRYAPLGWTQHFASEGKSCYKSSDVSYPAYLRVDDTKFLGTASGAAKFAGVEICQNMTSFDTAEWQGPYIAAYPNQNRETISGRSNGWFKWYYASSYSSDPDVSSSPNGNRHYAVVGDRSGFWIILYPYFGSESRKAAIIGMPVIDFGDGYKQSLVAVGGFGSSAGYPHISISSSYSTFANIQPFLDNEAIGRAVGVNNSAYVIKNILPRQPLFFKEDQAPSFLSGYFRGIDVVPSKTLGESIVFSGSGLKKIVDVGELGCNISLDIGVL